MSQQFPGSRGYIKLVGLPTNYDNPFPMLLNEKEAISFRKEHVPLTARPLDLFYFIYFIFHLLASALIDLQPLYPNAIIPNFLVELQKSYIADYGDPLVSGLYGLYGDAYKNQITWFTSFVYCEAFIQIPLFVYAIYALYHNLRPAYPILALYGTHAATTILPCIVHFLQTPVPCTTKHLVSAMPCLSPHQQRAVVALYGVFFVITLLITVDMGFRSKAWIEKALDAEKVKAE